MTVEISVLNCALAPIAAAQKVESKTSFFIGNTPILRLAVNGALMNQGYGTSMMRMLYWRQAVERKTGISIASRKLY